VMGVRRRLVGKRAARNNQLRRIAAQGQVAECAKREPGSRSMPLESRRGGFVSVGYSQVGFRSTTVMSQALSAWAEIDAARKYTYVLLEAFDQRQWFRQPNEGVTHIAWQVGHLAIAQYSLALSRLRGVQPGDDAILPASYEALFSRTTVPDPDATKYPPPAEIRATLDRVHVRCGTKSRNTRTPSWQPRPSANRTQCLRRSLARSSGARGTR
jgi:hypothetical protein